MIAKVKVTVRKVRMKLQDIFSVSFDPNELRLCTMYKQVPPTPSLHPEIKREMEGGKSH